MRRFAYWLALATLATNSSCTLIRRGRNKAQAPVIAAPPTKPNIPIENPQVPPPPRVEQAEAPAISPPVATQIPAKPPPKPKPARKLPRKPTAIRAQVPPPVVETTPEPAPQLSPVLSTAQQEAFNSAIDAAVLRAEEALASIARKRMNPTQQANAARARSFVSQAQQTRQVDLVTAKTLADRAVILAQSVAVELR